MTCINTHMVQVFMHQVSLLVVLALLSPLTWVIPQGQGKLGLFPAHADQMISPSSGSGHRSPWCPLTSLLDGSLGHTTMALMVSSVTTAPIPSEAAQGFGSSRHFSLAHLTSWSSRNQAEQALPTSPLTLTASSASHTQDVFVRS